MVRLLGVANAIVAHSTAEEAKGFDTAKWLGRWIEVMTVADLARHLGRNYKNVHTDVQLLTEWLAVERGDDGRVSVPWSEIVVDMKLPQPVAA